MPHSKKKTADWAQRGKKQRSKRKTNTTKSTEESENMLIAPGSNILPGTGPKGCCLALHSNFNTVRASYLVWPGLLNCHSNARRRARSRLLELMTLAREYLPLLNNCSAITWRLAVSQPQKIICNYIAESDSSYCSYSHGGQGQID